MLTAKTILAAKKPEALFSSPASGVSEDSLKKEFRALAKKWHPDTALGAGDVFSHIASLYGKGLDKIASGTWGNPGLLVLEGKKYPYLSSSPTDSGEVFVGEFFLAYFVKKEYFSPSDLMKNIPVLKYKDSSMEKEMARFLPHKEPLRASTPDGTYLVYEKSKGEFLLSDVVKAVASIPPKQGAWILSRLYNISCYLQWSGLVHCDINSGTVLINPVNHGLALVGGWWNCHKEGDRISSLPSKTYSVLPQRFLEKKEAAHVFVQEQIKAVGRELFSPSVAGSGGPAAVRNFLDLPCASDKSAQFFFAKWYEDILVKAFGPKKFVPWDLSDKDVYK